MEAYKNLIYRLILLSFVLIVAKVQAFTALNTSAGLGLETLMVGAGQARFGSTGALNSNPALLAWLVKEHEFISTNSISFYKLQSSDGGNYNVSPDVIPLFAASSEGFGNWGHSYGLMITKFKVNVDSMSGGYRAQGASETQTIRLSYGLGYKLSDDHAIGIATYFGRAQEESTFSAIGESSGFESAFIIRSKESFWVQGFSLGWAKKFETWGMGASTKFNTIKFGATAYSDQQGYSETTNSNIKQSDHELEPIKIIPDYRAGIQKKFETFKTFLDFSWNPSFTDPDGEEYIKSHLTSIIGLEKNLTEKYKLYSGLAFTPSNITGEDEPAIASLGFSRKGEHSVNFAGLNWTRTIKSAESEIIQINFGTKFDY